MVKRSDITLDKLLTDLKDDRELAQRLGQPSAAIAATQLTAKLAGLLVDRKESGQPGDFSSLTSPADVLAAIRAEFGDDAVKLLTAQVVEHEPEPTAPSEGDTIN